MGANHTEYGILCNRTRYAAPEAAANYYTLAARYGSAQARADLVRLGKPVPTADLAQRRQASGLESFGAGLQGAGAVLSPEVYNAQRGLPTPLPAYVPLVDLACVQRCLGGGNSLYGFCQRLCAY